MADMIVFAMDETQQAQSLADLKRQDLKLKQITDHMNEVLVKIE